MKFVIFSNYNLIANTINTTEQRKDFFYFYKLSENRDNNLELGPHKYHNNVFYEISYLRYFLITNKLEVLYGEQWELQLDQ